MPPQLVQEFANLISLREDVYPVEFELNTDICTLGRSQSCQIQVQRKIVSRLHARIQRDEAGRYILSDTNSANGTFVNGKRIREPYFLHDGDEIGLGSAEALLLFQDTEATLQVSTNWLYYDEPQKMFFLSKEPLELTPNQTRLLLHLYNHAYDLCTRASCAEALWGREYDPVMDTQALDRAIANLRQQLRKMVPDRDMIVTRRGIGYMLVLNADEDIEDTP